MGGGIYESLPKGVVFRPNDELLIDDYLIPKLWGENSRLKKEIPGNEAQVDIIPEVDDLCKLEPWELPTTLNHPVLSKFQTDQHERGGYFFSRLQKRYAKGHQVKRATNAGFWKSTGKERLITRMASGEVIGKRKTLVFHRKDGSSAARTPWFIYEYHADKRFVPDDKTNYVVCRFKRKAGTGILIDQSGGPAEAMTSNIAPDITNCKPDPQRTDVLGRLKRNTVEDIASDIPTPDKAGAGTGIHQNGIANNMTLGAGLSHHSSNIASDIGNYQVEEMTFYEDPELQALLNDFTSTPPGSDWFSYTEQGLDWDLPSPSGFINSYGSMQFQDEGDIEFMWFQDGGDIEFMQFQDEGDIEFMRFQDEGDIEFMQFQDEGDIEFMQFQDEGDIEFTQFQDEGDIEFMQFQDEGDIEFMQFQDEGDIEFMQFQDEGDIEFMQFQDEGDIEFMQFQGGDIEFADSLIVDPDECHCEGLIDQGAQLEPELWFCW